MRCVTLARTIIISPTFGTSAYLRSPLAEVVGLHRVPIFAGERGQCDFLRRSHAATPTARSSSRSTVECEAKYLRPSAGIHIPSDI